ncbi:CHC2 zinc finger domain-containing protein [Methylibium rhizosphaerae]|uniref:CHC2 zinc finger domain-containing protein n=1 Tax=Methylibium rhizosphaerae TaxID=2570323 RepID=UPI0011293B1B|nr:CHC2 zinc finger domain-containing protein [Methylibium rhizosphaerae]
MARIPEPELQRLKEEVSVQRLVEAVGVELKRAGKDWLGRCPFHDDAEASLVVSPAKNLWHCFGCGIGGGPIDWVMKHRGVSFRHAVELLKADPSIAAAGAAPAKRTTVRALPAPVALDADDQALLAQTIDYYHERLKQSPEALAYLKARGLDHPQLVDTFQLGVADRTLGLRLPEKNRQAGAAVRQRLQRIGLIRDSGHEHFNGSLVVPVFDAVGAVVEVYGRKLRDDLRAGTPKHLYLPGPHAGVFNLAGVIEAGQRAPGQREVILCEALIDAMTFWCAGFTNVTSAYGVEGFGDDLLAAFKAHGIERVLIAYDRDDAGERAAAKLAEALIAEGFEVLRVLFPKGMDANDYARKMSPPDKALALVLRQAQWIGGARPVQSPAAEEGLTEPALPTEDAPALPSSAAEPPARSADEAMPSELPDELQLDTGGITWRVRGWKKNTSAEVMKVNVQAKRKPEANAPADSTLGAYFVDTLDLYAARSRAAFLRAASIELGMSEDALKRELGAVLLKLEALQDALLTQARERQASTPKAPVLSADEEAQALELLQAPNLIERIVTDLHALGVVGEDLNLLAAYLAAVSRKLDTPLAVLIQSSSAAGKSSLMDAVLQLVPEEERIRYSAMTGQSLFYLGETNLQHKILAIAEEEGVRQAAYALKLLQSDGELTIASTAKDEATGNLSTRQYTVKGPVMLMLTTTAIDVDEELLNRCLVLSVNESREQTAAIHARQRQKQTLQGLLERNRRDTLKAVHHNAQRLLAPIAVVNPYADRLTFLADKTRTRRDHMKYLVLIQAIALLHQHQREVKTAQAEGGQALRYIEVTPADIELANAIAHEVLGRTLDELPPQTRRLLNLIRAMVAERAERERIRCADVRFTRRDIREATQWSDNQLKVHCARLAEMEFLLIHGGSRGHSLRYELLWDGSDEDVRRLCGLIDTAELHADASLRRPQVGAAAAQVGAKLAPSCPQVGVKLDAVNQPKTRADAGAAADRPINGAKTPISGADALRPVVPTAAH